MGVLRILKTSGAVAALLPRRLREPAEKTRHPRLFGASLRLGASLRSKKFSGFGQTVRETRKFCD